MRLCLATAVAVTLLASSGCKDKPGENLPPRDGKLGARRCAASSGPKNKNLPVLQRPFDKQFAAVALFDHQTPGDYKPFDGSSKELSYCGLETYGTLDGSEGYQWALPGGTHVLAAQEGEVTQAGLQPEYFCPLTGRTIEKELSVTVKHEGLGGIGFTTVYRSLQSVNVKVGDHIQAGQWLGASGRTGCVIEPVLAFVVYRLTGTKTGQPTVVDPYGWEGAGKDPWENHARGAESLYLWMEGEAPTLSGR